MPRIGWSKPETDQRLSDHLAIAMLTTIYPPWLVDDAIEAAGRHEQRQRMLSARVVLYHLLAMALYEEASYEEVMRRLLEGLAWQHRWPARIQVPTKAAIFKARTRLGIEPLTELFARSVQPLARSGAPGASYRGHPVAGIDDHSFELAASALKITAAVEGRTHAILDLAVADGAEPHAPPTPRVHPGVLYLPARTAMHEQLCSTVRDHDAELLGPAGADWVLTPVETLADGSELVEAGTLGPSATTPSRWRRLAATATGDEELVTTLTDPGTAPAAELYALYRERPTVAQCLDDLRVHESAAPVTLRSKSTDGAIQELYGVMLAHYAIRALFTDIDLAPISASPRLPQPRQRRDEHGGATRRASGQ